MHLYASKIHHQYELIHCPNNPLLKSIGIREGICVRVISRHPLGGPVVIRIEERDIAIDKTIATAILTKAVV